jgi:L-idonate 5-dehydrogenase
VLTDKTINTKENPQGLEPFTANKGTFDVLYECSGAASALIGAIAAIRPQGKIIQLGLGGDMTLPMMAITAKELSLMGSFRFHAEFATAVSLMRKGLINIKPLITHTLPLADAVKGFEMANDRLLAIKVQLEF